MRARMMVLNELEVPIIVEGHTFPPGVEQEIEADLTSTRFQRIRTTKGLCVGKPWQIVERKGHLEREREERRRSMPPPPIAAPPRVARAPYRVSVFNTLHFPVKVEGFVFPPGEEVFIEVEGRSSMQFRNIRTHRGLRVGKHDNDLWRKRHWPDRAYPFNMVYDIQSQHRGSAYVHAIEALANPIVAHLPENEVGFTSRPMPGLNLRFFSQMRINQQGKYPVGAHDVFMSHGVADKNYWLARHIAGYPFALVPGPAWKERIEAGGYRGRVYVVGYTKLDPLFQGQYQRARASDAKPLVVWAPTHGYNGQHRGRSSYPQCMGLIKEIPDCYDAIVALHPTSRLNMRREQDVTLQELLDADVVIADAGSTLYEAWALGKPVIFPDWICRDDVIGHFQPGNLEYDIYAREIGYHAKDMKHLNKLIEIALRDGMRPAEKEFIERIIPTELRGKAGETAAQALLEIRKELRL